jgi:hypothetical protein
MESNTVRPTKFALLEGAYQVTMPDGRTLAVTLHADLVGDGSRPTRWIVVSLQPDPGARWARHGMAYSGRRYELAAVEFLASLREARAAAGEAGVAVQVDAEPDGAVLV